jgi:alcohol dehydrogenase (cytochrome c)
MRQGKWATLPLVLSAALVACPMQSSAQNQSVISQAQVQQGSTGADWPTYGGTNLFWRYSSLNQINSTNVKKLAPAWIFQTGDYQDALQATPIVIDGTMYLSSARSNVFAIDAATGQLIWQYKHQPLPGYNPPARTKSYGLAVADGKVFMATYDDFVIAFDRKTGQEIWRVAVEDPFTCRCTMSAAAFAVKDKVIVSGGGLRGYVAAFDMKTGHIAWRFNTVPAAGEPGSETWSGDSWKTGAVVNWFSGSYDAELNLIYWGTGNAKPDFFGATRKGSNLYSSCIIALDADTGKLKWFYQEVPHDSWDYDSNWEPVLMDRVVNGRMRKLLVHINKGGFSWVLDRVTGEVVGTYPDNENINWVKGVSQSGELIGRHDVVENEPAWNVCPSNLGGKSWNHTAYSPRTTWIYIPMIEMCNDIVARPPILGVPSSAGGIWVMKPPPGKESAYSHIDAFDPVTGKRQWTYRYQYPLLASVLGTAGDLVFSGDAEGHFFALDARTGQKLWSFQTGAGNRGSSITYLVDGRQYVATPTGWGSVSGDIMSVLWTESDKWRLGSTLVVFALPEDSK